jgi:hypothetical protein
MFDTIFGKSVIDRRGASLFTSACIGISSRPLSAGNNYEHM